MPCGSADSNVQQNRRRVSSRPTRYLGMPLSTWHLRPLPVPVQQEGQRRLRNGKRKPTHRQHIQRTRNQAHQQLPLLPMQQCAYARCGKVQPSRQQRAPRLMKQLLPWQMLVCRATAGMRRPRQAKRPQQQRNASKVSATPPLTRLLQQRLQKRHSALMQRSASEAPATPPLTRLPRRRLPRQKSRLKQRSASKAPATQPLTRQPRRRLQKPKSGLRQRSDALPPRKKTPLLQAKHAKWARTQCATVCTVVHTSART